MAKKTIDRTPLAKGERVRITGSPPRSGQAGRISGRPVRCRGRIYYPVRLSDGATRRFPRSEIERRAPTTVAPVEPGGECAWCGAPLDDEPEACGNRRGETFCRPDHRTASNRALRRLLGREPVCPN